ncbi:hypothetical protein LINPERPRIM_LOCUS14715 [Linum perenne]
MRLYFCLALRLLEK